MVQMQLSDSAGQPASRYERNQIRLHPLWAEVVLRPDTHRQAHTCPACQRSVLVPWAPLISEAPKTSEASPVEPALPATGQPPELPKISIPKLSPAEIAASVERPTPKVLQLQGRNRTAPRFSLLA